MEKKKESMEEELRVVEDKIRFLENSLQQVKESSSKSQSIKLMLEYILKVEDPLINPVSSNPFSKPLSQPCCTIV